MCKEFGIVARSMGSTRKRKKEVDPSAAAIRSTETDPYDTYRCVVRLNTSPDIKQLCEFFPQYKKECLAAIYWDTENSVDKTVNRIVGSDGSSASMTV